MPNRHPLTRDFQMYYVGTWVVRQGAEGLDVMYVRAVTHRGDDRNLENIQFHGEAHDATGHNLGEQTWIASQVVPRIPRYGYYNLGNGPVYLTYNLNNRTNRKGLDTRTILVNGRPFRDTATGRAISMLFNQCEFPGQFSRDLCVHSNRILWKGQIVGTLVNGNVTIFTTKENLKDYVCKQLGKFLTVKQVKVADE